MKKNIHFSVQGPFLTQLARDRLYHDLQLNNALDLLMSALQTSELTDDERKCIAYDILEGKAELTGTYTGSEDDDYQLVYPEEPEDLPGIQGLFKQLADKNRALKNDLNDAILRKNFLAQTLYEHAPYTFHENAEFFEDEFGEPLLTVKECDDLNIILRCRPDEPTALSNMMKSFLERMTDEETHTTEDYGWLAPDGTFHPVDFGEHQAWAQQYIRTNYSEEDWLHAGIHNKTIGNKPYNTFGDWLIAHHWVLLDNPAQGLAHTTKHPSYDFTKKQKEFLYQYYTERHHPEIANTFYEDTLST